MPTVDVFGPVNGHSKKMFCYFHPEHINFSEFLCTGIFKCKANVFILLQIQEFDS